MNTPVKPSQEINAHGQHRLVCGEQATKWAPYAEFTYLQGYVGVTDYYTGTGECVLSADEFCARPAALVGRSNTLLVIALGQLLLPILTQALAHGMRGAEVKGRAGHRL